MGSGDQWSIKYMALIPLNIGVYFEAADAEAKIQSTDP